MDSPIVPGMNNTILRDVLAKVLFGDVNSEFKKYIIPLQGNWYNPVDKEGQIATWIGYSIAHMEQLTRAEMYGNEIVSFCDVTLHLQAMGPQAFEVASSTFEWNIRQDVLNVFHDMMNAFIYQSRKKIVTSAYYQEGQNTIFAYNVDVKFNYRRVVRPDVPILEGMELIGSLEIGG